MSIRVECCGIPGSGKSTLSAAALGELRRRGRAVAGRAETVDARLRGRNYGLAANTLAAILPGWREAFLSLKHGMDDWIRFVVRHPAYAALAHEWLGEPGMEEEWRRCVFHAVLTTAFEHELFREGDGSVLFDEGFAQRFFTLRGNGEMGREGDAERYTEAMPRPSGLVWISADSETCLERLERRPRMPILLAGETKEVRSRRLARGNEMLGALVYSAERRGIPALRIDCGESAESAGRKVADFVEGLR